MEIRREFQFRGVVNDIGDGRKIVRLQSTEHHAFWFGEWSVPDEEAAGLSDGDTVWIVEDLIGTTPQFRRLER